MHEPLNVSRGTLEVSHRILRKLLGHKKVILLILQFSLELGEFKLSTEMTDIMIGKLLFFKQPPTPWVLLEKGPRTV